ncbi:MAG: hypothetical protein J7517_08750 [Sphingobium yanoikuyae]|uniref:hypothetical protein n=1 Tax=Sphingobium yanoikuyae TaxID=13690 RepID=UPI001AFD67B8|nr:hypothetical protein [Sphingobium yanoikuyae]
MKRVLIILCALANSACTSTLKPVGVSENYSAFTRNATVDRGGKVQGINSGPITACTTSSMSLNTLISPDTSGTTTRLEWLNCEMLAKSMSNMEQAGWTRNRNEWRDVPIFGSAITAAALVLFGNRGANGNLTAGEVDVLEGLALGTAAFVALADYLSPEEAAQLLYLSAQGHRCIAEHGQTIAAYATLVKNKDSDYRTVVNGRDALAGLIDTKVTDAKKQNARAEVERADRTIAFYLKQKTALEMAPARSYLTAYDFGLELSKRARRQPQSIGDIQKAIEEHVRLQQQAAGITAREVPPSGAVAFAAGGIEDTTQKLALSTNKLAETLPNIALLVSGFTLCKTNALAGAPLPVPVVDYIGIEEEG